MARGDWNSLLVRQALRHSRRVFTHSYFDIKVAPRAQDKGRLLVITPRRSGNAVKRNLFTRRIRSLFHEYNLQDKEYDWIFFAKPGIKHTTFALLSNALSSSLETLE